MSKTTTSETKGKKHASKTRVDTKNLHQTLTGAFAAYLFEILEGRDNVDEAFSFDVLIDIPRLDDAVNGCDVKMAIVGHFGSQG